MTSESISHHFPRWTFADRLRKVRREAGLSQAEFAAQIGVKDKAYGAWEIGANNPSDIVAVAQRIELAFGVPAAWMLGLVADEGAPPPPPERPRGSGNAAPRGDGDRLRQLTEAKRRRHAVNAETLG
jgi:transcriptional regulator with XRE-family HTH domain